jgi:hypothetical protein
VRRGASGGHFGRAASALLRGSGSERNDTHHSIHDTIFYIMRESGYSVRREQSGVMPIREGEAGGRVMDLVAADPRGGSWVLADVVVADPTRSTAVMVTVRRWSAGTRHGWRQR